MPRIKLLLENAGKFHYTWIKDLNHLLYNQSKQREHKHFCERCLHGYSREDLLSKIINFPQKVVKCMYDTYISEVKTFPDKTSQKWKTKLNTNLSDNDFLNFYNAMYSCTKSAKLRDFQYRILNLILVTNDKLSTWGIITGESCSFCHSTPESIMHLLRECEISKRLWSDVSEYIYDNSW